jgi:long-chain acyl-CoA synthetase
MNYSRDAVLANEKFFKKKTAVTATWEKKDAGDIVMAHKDCSMDLRKLVSNIAEKNHKNSILSFEKGQVINRSHQTVYADVMNACVELEAWGVKRNMRVGIRACNSYKWIIYDLALIEMRAISVAFTDDFATFNADQLIDKYALSLLVTSGSENPRQGSKHAAAIAYIDAENIGIKAIQRRLPSTDWDFENPGLVFSSGSSGHLKGLVLDRRGIEASVDAFTSVVEPKRDDCLLLFLPMSNFQQRLMYYSALWYGFDLIVTDPTRLFRALKDLHPTILIAPPMLYEAFETRFFSLPKWKQWLAQTLGGIARKLPVRVAREKLARGIFKEAYEALGGRMRFMITGMAPIKRSTLEMFNLMQLPLFETYGLTEFGNITLNLPGACKQGSVGRLLPGVRVDLAADGEIIAIREHRIASGYFECDEGEAEKTFVSTERVATGDIGRFDEDGYLYLIGRKKEMIITAGGAKIHPELIESEIDALPDVAKSVVLADPEASRLVAVVLPKNLHDAVASGRIEKSIDLLGERRPPMRVGKVIFTDLAFSRENGFLRPNLKLDRKKIARHFLGNVDPSTEIVETETAYAGRA